MKKRLLPILVAVLMVFAMMPMTAGTVFAIDADTTPPYLDPASLRTELPEGKTTATAGDTVRIWVNVTDDSEISFVYIRLKPETSSTVQKSMTYDSASGDYYCDFVIEEGTENGTWRIDQCYAHDKYSNQGIILNNLYYGGYSDAYDLSSTEFVVEGTNSDTTPPYLDPASLRTELPEGKTTATVGDTVRIWVNVTDDSEISFVYIRLKPETSSTVQKSMTYDSASGDYYCDFVIEEGTENGTWRIDQCYAHDKYRNQGIIFNNLYYGGYSDAYDLSSTEFVVEGTNSDTTPPYLDPASLRTELPEGKTTVLAGDTVRIWVNVTDDSEISFVYIRLKPETSSTVQKSMTYDSASGDYYCDFVIEEGTENGTWRIDQCYAHDKYRNQGIILNNLYYGGYSDAYDLSSTEFTVVKNCKITFNTNGGSEISPQYVLSGDKAAKPDDPTKDNFFFDGWYADEDLTEPLDFGSAINEDITVYAKWIEAVTITVGVYDKTNSVSGQGGTYTFNAEDMTHTIDKHIVAKGTPVQLVAAPADGYEFVGWSEGKIVEGTDELRMEPVGEVGSTEPSGQFNANEDVVLCAVFRVKNADPSDTEPPVFNVDSLTVSISGDKKVATVGDTVTISIEITDESNLKYADLHIYTPEGQEGAVKLVYNEETGKCQWSEIVTDQAVSGVYRIYGFVAEDVNGNRGVLVNSNIVDDGSVPTADLSAGDFTVEISTPIETFTVTFVDGQGNTLKTETVEKGKAATAPADPTREGYTFDGWDKDFSNITSDLIVTAKWKENTAPPAPTKIAIPTGKTLTYNGKAQTGVAAGTGYTLSGTKSATNAGSYKATATLKEGYAWSDGSTAAKAINWKISKAANPLTMKAKTATVKYSKLKKKAQTLAVTKVIKFTKDAKDKKTYTLSSVKKGKKSFKKKFAINKTTGKVTVKKGLKKGTYKVKVKVKAAGNTNYKASAEKTITFTVKVK